MCRRRQKFSEGLRQWAFILWVSTLIGCGTDNAGEQPASVSEKNEAIQQTAQRRDAQASPPTPKGSTPRGQSMGLLLGQAGTVTIDLPRMKRAVAEARVLRQWQTGVQPELAALKNQRLRQKVLVRALETRLVRQEVERRTLNVDPMMLEGLLQRAAQGVAPEKRLTLKQGQAMDLEQLRARIAARYGVPFETVRRVALDLLEHRALSDALMDSTTEDEIKKEWFASKNCIEATLYRIPRVPTSSEIDAAVKTRGDDMAEYYKENGRLFRTPARTFVKRLLIPVEDPSKKDSIRDQIEKLRGDVSSEATMVDAINQHGYPRDRRNGGRKTISKKQRPDLHEMPVGTVSPVEAHSLGWVFYFIEGHGSKVERSLDDRRVQREIAAALLRKDDRLIHAKQVAGQLAYKLRQMPNSQDIKSIIDKERVRTVNTGRFCRINERTVPGIGLAPELSQVLFALKSEGAVSRPVRVRQDYVVGVLNLREASSESDWTSVRTTYMPEWRTQNAPGAIKTWLSKNPAAKSMQVNSPRLQALTIDQLDISGSAAD